MTDVTQRDLFRFVYCAIHNGQLCDNYILFLVDYDNLKFTRSMLISASSRTFSHVLSSTLVRSGRIFTAAATFSVLIHLPTQVRGGVGQDPKGVLTRTLVEY